MAVSHILSMVDVGRTSTGLTAHQNLANAAQKEAGT